MHNTAIAGVLTRLSRVRKKAGPRNPIDCMICNIKWIWRSLSSEKKNRRESAPKPHFYIPISISPCLTNCRDRITSADKCICNPTPYICKYSHGQPWQDTEEPGFSEVELQNLKRQLRLKENSNFDRLSWIIVKIYWMNRPLYTMRRKVIMRKIFVFSYLNDLSLTFIQILHISR